MAKSYRSLRSEMLQVLGPGLAPYDAAESGWYEANKSDVWVNHLRELRRLQPVNWKTSQEWVDLLVNVVISVPERDWYTAVRAVFGNKGNKFPFICWLPTVKMRLADILEFGECRYHAPWDTEPEDRWDRVTNQWSPGAKKRERQALKQLASVRML